MRCANFALRWVLMTQPSPSEFCPRAAELPDLVHGGLNPQHAVELTTHVAACPDCREDLTVLRSLQRRWGDEGTAGGAFERRLRGQIPSGAFREPPRSGRTGLLIGVVITGLLLTLLVILYPYIAPRPRERAVELTRLHDDALAHILDAQAADGSICGGGESAQRYAVGITGLSMQALLTVCERPDCAQTLLRASEYVLRQQDADGLFGPPLSDAMYNHAPALTALLQCPKEAGGRRFDGPIRKGLSALLARQKDDGGFGYSDSLTGNSVISIWPLETLLVAQRAHHAGLEGPIERLRAFLSLCRAEGPMLYAPGSRAASTDPLAAIDAYREKLIHGEVALTVLPPGQNEAFALSFYGRSGSLTALERMLECTQNGAGTSFNSAYCSVTRDAVASAALSVLALTAYPAVLVKR